MDETGRAAGARRMLTAEDLLLLTDDETGGGPAGPTLLEEVAHLLRWAVGCRATAAAAHDPG